MVVDDFWFWFWFGLDYWFKFVGQFRCPLWGTTLVLCGTTTLAHCEITTPVLCGAATLVLYGTTTPILYGTATLVLCGTITLVICGTYHPLWLSFCLIGWFGLWLRLRLSFGDSLGQGYEATIWVVWFTWQPSIPPPLMN
jgi:hypothetical protein